MLVVFLCYTFLLLLTLGSDAILCGHVIVRHYEREVFIEGNHGIVVWLPWCTDRSIYHLYQLLVEYWWQLLQSCSLILLG